MIEWRPAEHRAYLGYLCFEIVDILDVLVDHARVIRQGSGEVTYELPIGNGDV